MIICTSVEVQAAKKSDDWISKSLIDYEPLQNLLLEYPDASKVEDKTSYILDVTTKNSKGDILKKEKKTFSNLEDMETYVAVSENEIVPYSIEHGETAYKTYTKMRVGLTLYKYSSSYYFVAFVYEWLTPPSTSAFTNMTEGVVGLALDTGLSMDGSSYAGRLTINYWDHTETRTNSNGGLSIQATGTQGIGYPFSFYNPNKYADSAEGVISCKAYKQAPNFEYVSAYGEYADVSMTLDLDNFSVSIPAGISFNLATSKTSYSIQDTLTVKDLY